MAGHATSAWYPTLSTMSAPQMCQMTSISMTPNPSNGSTVTYHHSLASSQNDENQYATSPSNIPYGPPNLDNIYGKKTLKTKCKQSLLLRNHAKSWR